MFANLIVEFFKYFSLNLDKHHCVTRILPWLMSKSASHNLRMNGWLNSELNQVQLGTYHGLSGWDPSYAWRNTRGFTVDNHKY
jgi:hypothetical protein